MKVWKQGGRIFYVKEKGMPVSVDSAVALHRKLNIGNKLYMVQQGIDLATINGRPYDIRQMMMRDQFKRWKSIGMIAKVAGPRSVITNVARGKGYVLPIDKALKQSLGLSEAAAEKKKNEMIRLASLCTRIYNKIRYDWQIGYDIAVDRRGKVWLIETNPTVPSHALFRKMPKLYRTIKRFAAYHRPKSMTVQRK